MSCVRIGAARRGCTLAFVLAMLAAAPPLAFAATRAEIDSLLAPARAAFDAERLRESDSLAARVTAHAARSGDSLLWLEGLRQQNRARLGSPRMSEPLALALADSALALGIALRLDTEVPVLIRYRGKVLHAHRRIADAERALGAARRALMALPVVDTARAAQWLVEQSEALYTLGRYSAAVESLTAAIRAFGSMARPDTAGWANALNGLASTQLLLGAEAAAESLWLDAYALRLRIRPPVQEDIAQSLSNLGTSRHRRGDYEGAVKYYEQSIRIYEAIDSRVLPYALDGLARARVSQGRPLEARRIWERAVDLLEAQGASSGTQSLNVMNGLTDLYRDLGDLHTARAQADTVYRRYQRLFGSAHRETASSAAILAGLLARSGQRREALVLARRASHTLDSLLGPDNERSTVARSTLARILERGRDATEAREAEAIRTGLLRSQAVQLGALHPRVALARLALAHALIDRGALEPAAQQADSAALVMQRLYGPGNPLLAPLYEVRSRLAAARGQREEAVDLALASVDATRSVERVSAREFSEREAIALGGRSEWSLGSAVELLGRGAPLPSRVAPVWDRMIESRMRALDAAARRRGLAMRPDSAIRAHAATLEDARGAYARQWVRAARDTAPPDAGVLAMLRQRMEAAERALAASDPVFAAGTAMDTASGPAVRAAVPRGEALVGYWRHTGGDTAAYAAFVRGPTGAEQCFDLGPAARIEAAIEDLRLVAGRPPGRDDRAAATRAWRAAEAVTALVWTPLRAAIGDASRIHVVPDHALARVPFTALTAEPGHYRIESGAPIVVRASERELLASPAEHVAAAALVVGAPDFGAAPARRASGDCVSLADVVFAPLPGALEEASGVARTLSSAGEPVVAISGVEATEAAFIAQAPHHRFLHLATHAFVLGESCAEAPTLTRGVGRLVRPAAAPRAVAREHDRVVLEGRVGLAFAGANGRASGQEDGILTAEEIVGLDLGGVDCAVLSACETGVGPLATGEGALGLHRAFRIAGARSVVMSLWALGDRSARDWSLAFWSERVAGRATWQAAWDASRLRLEAARSGGASTHPFHWAAFTAWAAPGR